MKLFKIQDTKIASFVGRNSAADCPFSMKFYLEKQFLYRMLAMGQIPAESALHRTSFILFLIQFGLGRAAAFVSSPIGLHLFYLLYRLPVLLSF